MLCDAPGLGKTSVAIAYMLYLADRHRFKGPFLVVCADSSLKTWNDMIHWSALFPCFPQQVPSFPALFPSFSGAPYALLPRHAPHWRRIEYHPYVDKYYNPIWNMRKPFDVIVTTMSMLVRSRALKKRKWPCLIHDDLDKVLPRCWHYYADELAKIDIGHRLLLGSSALSTVDEMWFVAHMLKPRLFGGRRPARKGEGAGSSLRPLGPAGSVQGQQTVWRGKQKAEVTPSRRSTRPSGRRASSASASSTTRSSRTSSAASRRSSTTCWRPSCCTAAPTWSAGGRVGNAGKQRADAGRTPWIISGRRTRSAGNAARGRAAP